MPATRWIQDSFYDPDAELAMWRRTRTTKIEIIDLHTFVLDSVPHIGCTNTAIFQLVNHLEAYGNLTVTICQQCEVVRKRDNASS